MPHDVEYWKKKTFTPNVVRWLFLHYLDLCDMLTPHTKNERHSLDYWLWTNQKPHENVSAKSATFGVKSILMPLLYSIQVSYAIGQLCFNMENNELNKIQAVKVRVYYIVFINESTNLSFFLKMPTFFIESAINYEIIWYFSIYPK